MGAGGHVTGGHGQAWHSSLHQFHTLFLRKGVPLFCSIPRSLSANKGVSSIHCSPSPASPLPAAFPGLSPSLVNSLLSLFKVGGEGPRGGGPRSERVG